LGLNRPRQRRECIVVLGLTGKLKPLGAIFGKGAHQTAFVIGVFQAIKEHMVDHLPMAQPRPAAHFRQHIGRVGHALHAARDHHIGMAKRDLVKGHHRRFHARAAHFIERGGGRPALNPA